MSVRTIFAAGQHRKLATLPESFRAPIATMEVPTTGSDVGRIILADRPAVNDQGAIGDCGSVAACTWLYQYLWHKGIIDPRVSWTFFYFMVRLRGGYDVLKDTGSTVSDTIVTALQIGFCPESVYANDDSKWNIAPPAEAISIASLHRLLFAYYLTTVETIDACLLQGFPILFGMDLTEGFEKVDGSGIYTPSGKFIGGHAMGIVGKDDNMVAHGYKGFYLVQNQWGVLWGLGGLVWIPKQLFMDGTAREMCTGRRTQL